MENKGAYRNDGGDSCDRFLKDIYDSQSEFEVPEPEGLWKGIEASLAEEERTVVLPWRRWVFPVTGAVSAAAAVALFFLLGGLKSNVSTLPSTASGSIPVSEEAVAVVPSPSTGLPFQSIAAEPSAVAASPASASSSIAASPASAPSYKSVPASTATRDEVSGMVSDVAVGVPSTSDSAVLPDAWDVEPDATDDSQRHKRQGGQHRFSFSANASSVGGMRNSSNGYAALSSSDVTRQVSELSAMGKEYSQVLLSNNNSEVSTLTKHFQPVRFSVTASYRFNRVISIESGLSYTCLVSNLSSGSDRGKYTTRQQLHYIGIPLNVRLDLWSIRNFSMYFSGGGMMEKCVAGKSVTKYEVEGLKDSRASSSLSEKQLQWSVNGAFGAQYRFNELVGLYVEPGVSYYFNNGSSIENIYKERPLNFNVALGLRFYIP